MVGEVEGTLLEFASLVAEAVNREVVRDRMGRKKRGRGRAMQEKKNGGGKKNFAIEGMAR